MVTFMSMGSKWLGSTIATSGSKEMIQRQTVAAGVDVSFALVTLFVVVAFSFALFIKNLGIRIKILEKYKNHVFIEVSYLFKANFFYT